MKMNYWIIPALICMVASTILLVANPLEGGKEPYVRYANISLVVLVAISIVAVLMAILSEKPEE